MNRRVQCKKALFTLEPDGFSIHTFELSRKITSCEYRSIKETLYQQQKATNSKKKSWIYPDGYGNHICTLYSTSGIHSIRLEHNRGDGVDTYFIRMVINPRKLIDPGCSYIGILPPDKSSIKKLRKSFAKLFENTVFESSINAYQLARVDLCANIRCNHKKLFRELVRVLRKLPEPPKYTRKLYTHQDKKKANRYNKHYLRFCCDALELVIYDKTYQMQEGGLVVSYEKLPEGVLRFEVHYEREYIRRIEREFCESATDDLLWRLVQESEERMIKHFSQCFSDVRFVQMEELEQRIKQSTFKKENKTAMLELATRLQRTQTVDKALKKLEKEGFHTAGILGRLDKLGISPIPLWKNFCAKELPGPVELLRAVSGGELSVEYVKVKYK